ncbi:MAG TPA: BON domain-containing protein [Solirubrobacteraceae bacterium]|nr:BON domain-containing protein [Solirubrobacteraceae bacterium]
MSDDQAIIDAVRDRIAQDSHIPHPTEIAVASQMGTVTLRGSVGSFRQRRAAIDAAKTVRGVRGVEDELRVDLLDHWDDDQLRGVAIQALIEDRDVPDDRIEVSVSAAWLTLKGEVKHQAQSNAAFEAVSGIPGVGGITNKIAVITAGIDG